uniref:Uncharacterized protein n=1 Tax=Quercus lobata TaxID=97700 RepID=A0A7N2N4L7_QUELO
MQVDIKHFRKPTMLLEWMGMNALIVYALAACDLFLAAVKVPKNAFASWLVVKKNKLTTKDWQIEGIQGHVLYLLRELNLDSGSYNRIYNLHSEPQLRKLTPRYLVGNEFLSWLG